MDDNSPYECAADFKSLARNPHKKIYDDLVLRLRGKLQAVDVVTRMEYVGSQYKKTGVDASDYDNLFVKRDKTIDVQIYDPTDSKRSNNRTYVHLFRAGKQLDPKRELRIFRSHVHKAMNKLYPGGKWSLAEHGCAMELRYGSPELFSVDLVFCYEVLINRQWLMYTAKPPRNAAGRAALCWKLSTAIEEKEMSKIDRQNTCCRWAIRVMKAICKEYAPLQILTSYTIEQVFHRSWVVKPLSFWNTSSEQGFKEVVRFLLEQLASTVQYGSLSNYYNPDEDVMPYMSSITRSNVVGLLRRLSRDPALDQLLRDISRDRSQSGSLHCRHLSDSNISTDTDDSTDEEEIHSPIDYRMNNLTLAENGDGSMFNAQKETTSSGLGWVTAVLAIGAAATVGFAAYSEYKNRNN